MEYCNKKLEEFNHYIAGKKIAILGIGVSNLPLLDYFYEKKARVTVFDNRSVEEMDKNIMGKIEQYRFSYFLGKDNLEHLKGFDLIFRSPSAMPFKKEIEEEIQRGAIVTTEIEMVLKLTPSKTIGVTGTEGKTTTTTLIYEILKQTGHTCFLGGNIGTPLFSRIQEMKPEDFVILEMSSFQLIDMDVSPEVSLVTNLYPDHLNIHRSYEEYQEAKKNIFKHQTEEGIVVLNYDNEITRSFAKEAKGKVLFFSSKEKLQDGYIYDITDQNIKFCKEGVRRHLLSKNEIKLRGIHNYENICAALAVTSAFISTEEALKVVQQFNGVEHRLEFVKEIEGVKYYNDSIGTSPASTIAGLHAFEEKIVLIAGGSDKGLDYKEVGEAIAQTVTTLILCGPTSMKIAEATQKAMKAQQKLVEICYVANLEEAVKLAKKKAKTGDIVLLSPASASFDAFQNFAERGNKFKEYVKQLERYTRK